MAEYTPGPWEVAPYRPRLLRMQCEIKTVLGWPGMDASELSPAQATAGRNAEGNARLIAAAPSLLAACEAAVEEARERDEDMGMNCWPALLAAIADAKGGPS